MAAVVLMCRVDGFFGGVERHILQVAGRLDPERYCPVIVSIANHGELERIAKEKGFATDFIPMKHRWNLPSAAQSLVSIMQRRNANLVHTFGIRSNTIAYYARGSYPIPWVIRLPNINSTDYSNPVRGWISHWFNNILIRRADALQVISQPLIDYVQSWKHPPRRVYPIRNGVDVTEYRRDAVRSNVREELSIPSTSQIVGSVGRLVSVKNYEGLIRAFSRIASEKDVHLLLVGEGPERERLQRLAQDLSLEHCVHLPGYRSDIRSYLAAMDCFVCFSHSEGVPNAVMEAMAMRLAVISTRVGGVESLLESGREGVLVPAGDKERLALTLRELLENSEKREKMAMHAEQRARKQFSLQRMVDEVQKMYDDLLVE